MDRRSFIKTAAGFTAGITLMGTGVLAASQRGKPNIVVIMADDMGYSDLGCYGSESIATPSLDSLAAGGVKMTSFYSASPVCSPSRCGLLTGRYPARARVYGVYFPSMNLATPLIHSQHGLGDGMNLNEIVSASLLKDAGYNTCCVGKWHLGDKRPYRPNHRGFDHYLGLHYSNDMTPLPLYMNDRIVKKAPVDQDYLTYWYTREACKWIGENRDDPFFLYVAHTFPHAPLHASPDFRGRSQGGLYGDCIEEIDWSTGKIVDTLKQHGLLENTLVFFTSDNGPWIQGSAGRARGRKGEIFDGGMRVPGIAHWPAAIPAGRDTDEMAMNIDLFPTILSVAGAAPPADRIIDGRNILPLLTGDAKSPHEVLFYYDGKDIVAARTPRWKYHRRHTDWTTHYKYYEKGPVMFDMDIDRDESYNVLDKYPAEAKRIESIIADWEAGFINDVPEKA